MATRKKEIELDVPNFQIIPSGRLQRINEKEKELKSLEEKLNTRRKYTNAFLLMSVALIAFLIGISVRLVVSAL